MPNIQNVVHKYLVEGRSWYQRKQSDIKKITVHHSAIPIDGRQTNDSVLQRIMNTHVGHGWPGLSYHFAIMPDGTIYQCNNFEDITWHDTINDDSIGVLVHGYFHPDVNDRPTSKQLLSLKELLDWLCTENPAFPADFDDVVGHRDRSATACPGDFLYAYVTEYREKLGQVDWSAQSDCEKALAAMEQNKDEWKAKAREREQNIIDLKKEIREKDEQYEKAKQLITLMEEKQNECIQKANQYSKDLVITKDKLKDALETNVELQERIKELESVDGVEYTFSQIRQIVLNYIKRKLNG